MYFLWTADLKALLNLEMWMPASRMNAPTIINATPSSCTSVNVSLKMNMPTKTMTIRPRFPKGETSDSSRCLYAIELKKKNIASNATCSNIMPQTTFSCGKLTKEVNGISKANNSVKKNAKYDQINSRLMLRFNRI